MGNPSFSKSDVVWHPHFGKGTVISVDSKRDAVINIKFEESTKTILSKFVKKMEAVSLDTSKSHLTIEQILGKLYEQGMKDVEIYDECNRLFESRELNNPVTLLQILQWREKAFLPENIFPEIRSKVNEGKERVEVFKWKLIEYFWEEAMSGIVREDPELSLSKIIDFVEFMVNEQMITTSRRFIENWYRTNKVSEGYPNLVSRANIHLYKEVPFLEVLEKGAEKTDIGKIKAHLEEGLNTFEEIAQAYNKDYDYVIDLARINSYIDLKKHWLNFQQEANKDVKNLEVVMQKLSGLDFYCFNPVIAAAFSWNKSDLNYLDSKKAKKRIIFDDYKENLGGLIVRLCLRGRYPDNFIEKYLEYGFYYKYYQNEIKERFECDDGNILILEKAFKSSLKLLRRFSVMKLGNETTETTLEFLEDKQFIEAKSYLEIIKDKMLTLSKYKLKQCSNCNLVGIQDLWFSRDKNQQNATYSTKKCKLCNK
tara:strand:+ start:1450 stop:2892 length:1443 start_codon:yes stop_codon:yes gene_type:complete